MVFKPELSHSNFLLKLSRTWRQKAETRRSFCSCSKCDDGHAGEQLCIQLQLVPGRFESNALLVYPPPKNEVDWFLFLYQQQYGGWGQNSWGQYNQYAQYNQYYPPPPTWCTWRWSCFFPPDFKPWSRANYLGVKKIFNSATHWAG